MMAAVRTQIEENAGVKEHKPEVLMSEAISTITRMNTNRLTMGSQKTNALPFCQRRIYEPARQKLLRSEDYINIAVNGGTRHALSIGVVPQAIIGELIPFTPEKTGAYPP